MSTASRIRLSNVVFDAPDAPDAREPAAFYVRLLGYRIRTDEPGWVVIGPPDGTGTALAFRTERSYVPPMWPAGPGNQRMMLHLDIEVDDLAAETERALAEGALAEGAKPADHQPQEDVRVLLDPAGHPFCLWARGG